MKAVEIGFAAGEPDVGFRWIAERRDTDDVMAGLRRLIGEQRIEAQAIVGEGKLVALGIEQMEHRVHR